MDSREQAFEAWYLSRFPDAILAKMDGEYAFPGPRKAKQVWNAALSAAKQGIVIEGEAWQLVPVEPSNEMICGALEAGLQVMRDNGVMEIRPTSPPPLPSTSIKACFAAMLTAAKEQT